jgi:hypothetical protein
MRTREAAPTRDELHSPPEHQSRKSAAASVTMPFTVI